MVLGMSLHTYTVLHVLISFVAIASGLIVMRGLLTSRLMGGLTAFFLITTALTDVTGLLFPFHGVTPAIKLSIISLVVLAIAIVARYPALRWRKTYVICAVASLYFSFFVLVVQSFEKVPVLHALAPTQKEAPFAAAQIAVLIIFVVLAALAVKAFHPEAQEVARVVKAA